MHRQQKFLPIVLLALVMQILAPVAACWAAGIAAADPLQSAGICHSDASTGSGDQGREQYAHDGLCAICATHAAAAADAPKPVGLIHLARRFRPVPWPDAAQTLSSSRIGSNSQARAPPPSA
ncbi:DUF2946 family protein [Bradyrhizobium sp. AZCC 1693]|uniref:DUF2946 family protein n=1 Tax=Bradyrhizobium sp. AZCC 1693 TaxID=3117029 RepID=UPI003FA587E0